MNKKQNKLYEYLDACGVLDTGNETAISEARKMYVRNYRTQWRKNRRAIQKEFTTNWSPDEVKLLAKARQCHNMSYPAFIKASTLAYLDKRYIVPDLLTVRQIAQFLSMTYSSIQDMTDENAIPLQTGKVLLDKILQLEREILPKLHNPKTLDQLIIESIQKTPEIKSNLIQLLESLP